MGGHAPQGSDGESAFIRRLALASLIGYSLSDLVYISATEKLRNFVAKTGSIEVPTGKSLYDILEGAEVAQKVYPTLATPTILTSGIVAWTHLSTWTQIIPADTITTRFAVLGAYVQPSSIVNSRWWEIELAQGAADSETLIGTLAGQVNVQSAAGFITMDSFIPLAKRFKLAANARVSGRAANNGTNAESYYIKVYYAPLPLA